MFLQRIKTVIDWEIFTIVILITLVGTSGIYSSTQGYGNDTNYFLKQLIWLFVGILIMFAGVIIPTDLILKSSLYFHLVIIFLLFLVLLYGVGNRASDVRRWLDLKVTYFQPSEFAKFSLVLFIAWYFREGRKFGSIKWYDYLLCSVFTLIPFFFILRQPDLGTAMILPIIMFVVFFVSGLNYKIILGVVITGLASMPLLWGALKEYQKQRILTMFDPELDPLGKGYHIIQSKIAVGSGSIFGKGFLEGKQAQLNFLPAKHTDFIFALFNEERGFIGGTFLLFLYFLLAMKCLSCIGKAGNRTAVVISAGIGVIIISHTLINVGMVIGVLPVVGIPLPFFSYGGSSLLTLMFGLGVMMSFVADSRVK